jgi:adenylosuccinate synthase
VRDGRPLARYPTDPDEYASLTCEWKEVEGFSWQTPPTSLAQLPAAARAFLEQVQGVTGVPLRWLSVSGTGPLIDV